MAMAPTAWRAPRRSPSTASASDTAIIGSSTLRIAAWVGPMRATPASEGEKAAAEPTTTMRASRIQPSTLSPRSNPVTGRSTRNIRAEADEITSALDVSVQAAIIELLADLRTELETSFLFISHDLAVVRTIADRVVVLQHGTIREQGDADAVFRHPEDPYTRALLEAVPEIRTRSRAG